MKSSELVGGGEWSEGDGWGQEPLHGKDPLCQKDQSRVDNILVGITSTWQLSLLEKSSPSGSNGCMDTASGEGRRVGGDGCTILCCAVFGDVWTNTLFPWDQHILRWQQHTGATKSRYSFSLLNKEVAEHRLFSQSVTTPQFITGDRKKMLHIIVQHQSHITVNPLRMWLVY